MPTGRGQPISHEVARRVYNRIGRFQDWQRFYEGPATADMIGHGAFGRADAVFELGCGTGALAAGLLDTQLPSGATYLGVDVSDTMVRLATERLTPWTGRASVQLVDGTLPLPGEDGGFDRFVGCYVFDLLDPGYSAKVMAEAKRLLRPGGILCSVSLTSGVAPLSKVVCRGWRWMWERAPELVGGCRPITVEPLLADGWKIVHRRTVTAWGVPSEVIVAPLSRRG